MRADCRSVFTHERYKSWQNELRVRFHSSFSFSSSFFLFFSKNYDLILLYYFLASYIFFYNALGPNNKFVFDEK